MQYQGIESSIVETRVEEVRLETDKLLIKTVNTNLRHRYGAQLEDHGYIYLGQWVRFNEIIMSDMSVYGELSLEYSTKVFPGMIVLLKRDEGRRKRISRMHSAIHVICGESGLPMLRSYAGSDISRIDFLGDIRQFEMRLDEINVNVNSIVSSGLAINTLYLTSEQVQDRGDVEEFSLKMKGLIRVIEIESFDARVCLGSHVGNTAEVGLVRISPPKRISSNSFKINVDFEN